MMTAKRKGRFEAIRDVDDLYRVLREVRAEDEPLVLRLDTGEEIVIEPRHHPAGDRAVERTGVDDERFLSSAGSWRGLVDADEFKRTYKAARGSRRTPVVLEPPIEQ